MNNLKQIVQELTNQGKTISTMESCTGGGLANAITNIEGASEIIKFSAVTYSNEFKIQMGVSEEVINRYSVYSMETAIEMSKNISKFTNSDYGIGITGKLNRVDKRNLSGSDNVVYISIYDKNNAKFYNENITVTSNSRIKNKDIVIEKAINSLTNILQEKNR